MHSEKKTKLPAELVNHDEILERISNWKEKYEDIDKQIRKISTKGATSKEDKDSKIRRRHYLILQRDYWRGKYQRFTMTEVPEGFSRRQGTDISVISRYARMYLKSVFKQVYIVKGIATSDFRKMWGIQDEYAKKERVNHVHHCIDAITIACIGKAEYDKLADYRHQYDDYLFQGKTKPTFDKPWPSFVIDIKHIQDELLIAHYAKDNLEKFTKKNLRGKDGRIIRDKFGNKLQMKGDTSRNSLHNDKFYGAINHEGEIKYVYRTNIEALDAKSIGNIVDPTVRSIIESAIAIHGSLKAAINKGIWMNEEKHIPIKKVRVFRNDVKKPIELKDQRDLSDKDYKQHYYVTNDGNYMMLIFSKLNNKGREIRQHVVINSLEATEVIKSHKRSQVGKVVWESYYSKEGFDLIYKLKSGTMILLYENNRDEVWDLDIRNLQKRLYIITKMKYDGRIYMMHHQEAREKKDLEEKSGSFKINEDYRPLIVNSYNQFNALVQDLDFEINDLGEIRRLI